MNRLASSTSPYLRQHAANPVDWWEWGEDAFAEAHRRDVPVLLSVGYAACHWCQVAEPRDGPSRHVTSCAGEFLEVSEYGHHVCQAVPHRASEGCTVQPPTRHWLVELVGR